jgi:hypothetical protein
VTVLAWTEGSANWLMHATAGILLYNPIQLRILTNQNRHTADYIVNLPAVDQLAGHCCLVLPPHSALKLLHELLTPCRV